jgi:hypothetical protein
MKALKSQLAKDVLADPDAKGRLRAYLAEKSVTPYVTGAVIEVRTNGRMVRVKPTVVPKAA